MHRPCAGMQLCVLCAPNFSEGEADNKQGEKVEFQAVTSVVKKASKDNVGEAGPRLERPGRKE